MWEEVKKMHPDCIQSYSVTGQHTVVTYGNTFHLNISNCKEDQTQDQIAQTSCGGFINEDTILSNLW